MVNNLSNIKGYLILVFSILLVFVILPYSLWKNHDDAIGINERGRITTCKVKSVAGLKGNNIHIEYFARGTLVKKIVTAPSSVEPKVGDVYKLRYDSIEVENAMVLW